MGKLRPKFSHLSKNTQHLVSLVLKFMLDISMHTHPACRASIQLQASESPCPSELAWNGDCILLLWHRGNTARTQLNVLSHCMPTEVVKLPELTDHSPSSGLLCPVLFSSQEKTRPAGRVGTMKNPSHSKHSSSPQGFFIRAFHCICSQGR